MHRSSAASLRSLNLRFWLEIIHAWGNLVSLIFRSYFISLVWMSSLRYYLQSPCGEGMLCLCYTQAASRLLLVHRSPDVFFLRLLKFLALVLLFLMCSRLKVHFPFFSKVFGLRAVGRRGCAPRLGVWAWFSMLQPRQYHVLFIFYTNGWNVFFAL